MKEGLAIPVGVDNTGSAAWARNTPNDVKTISLAISDGDNDNAFQQDLGLDSSVVFSVMDYAFQALVTEKLRSIFRQFERDDRYKLLPESMKWKQEKEGEMILEFSYQNLETDNVITFSKSYT
jgi:hypothetical protein